MKAACLRALAPVCVLLVAACGGSGGDSNPVSPASSNHPPTISASVANTFGMSQLSSFSFSASASDPDGDSVTVSWNFGDGTAASGTSVSHTYTNSGGSVTVTATATDSKGASSVATVGVTVGSFTGNWQVTNACGTFAMNFTQTGTSGSGTITFPAKWCNVPAGTTGKTDPAEPPTIDASGNVVIRYKAGIFIDAYLRGKMDSSGQRVTGGTYGSGFNGEPFTMTK